MLADGTRIDWYSFHCPQDHIWARPGMPRRETSRAAVSRRPPRSAARGRSEAQADTRARFTALAAAWNEAIIANDPDAIAAFAEPDWALVGGDGIVSGKQFLESVAAGRVSHHSMTTEVLDVRTLGQVAVVISRVRNSGEYDGEPFRLDEWTTDIFVERDGRWRCLLTHCTPATEKHS